MSVRRGTTSRQLTAILAAAGLIAIAARVHADRGRKTQGTQSAAPSQTPGHYADVNGIKLYYEIHGAGRPLVLLHGGLGAIEM
jgi:hypothetical protein